jgi:hypothetical protein
MYRYLDVFYIPESIISTATISKNGDCRKQEIISPMTFIPHITLAMSELEGVLIILNKVFQMIYVWIVCDLSLLYILRMMFYVLWKYGDPNPKSQRLSSLFMMFYELEMVEKRSQ